MPVARIASSALPSISFNDGYADRHCRFHCFNTLPADHAPRRTFTCPATRTSTI
jgi:hypothetical protein